MDRGQSALAKERRATNLGMTSCWRTYVWLILSLSLCAQELSLSLPSLGSAPQAKSQQEFDDWLDLLGSTDPQRTVRTADEFLARYPQTEFAGRTYQAQMLAYQQLDNYEATVAAGKRALQLHPENLHVLATLANVIPLGVPPGRPDDPRLEEAIGYARQLLSRLATQKIPRSFPLTEWRTLKLQLEVSAHAAFGLVMLQQGQAKEAVQELEWVTQHDPAADAVHFLRLGSAYLATRNYCPASGAFQRASALGPKLARKKAEEAQKNIASMTASCAH
jgi:tetratricopeptide (TPR) repeat protein